MFCRINNRIIYGEKFWANYQVLVLLVLGFFFFWLVLGIFSSFEESERPVEVAP